GAFRLLSAPPRMVRLMHHAFSPAPCSADRFLPGSTSADAPSAKLDPRPLVVRIRSMLARSGFHTPDARAPLARARSGDSRPEARGVRRRGSPGGVGERVR